MKVIIGGIFIFSGMLALFGTEPIWYAMVDFAIGYLLLEGSNE